MGLMPWLKATYQKKFKVLVIDDLAENIALITNILKEEYDIIAATNVRLGLELANKEPLVDLILLDIVMPSMNGYEVCEHLKANPLTQEIPIIFLTVLDETADVEKGFLVGGVDYVTKPFEPTILKARVKTHCELSFQRAELKRFNQSLEVAIVERTRELESSQLYNERLARQAALGDIISMVAHQWKQPLGVISMIVNSVLLDIALEKVDVTSLQNSMDNITKQTQYLAQTIENFRHFFKPNQEKQVVELKLFFESLMGLMKAILAHHAISLTLDIQGVERMSVYQNELLQVLVNLINNAKDAIISHATHHGNIDIHVLKEGEDLLFDVCDNGGGIAEDVMDKIGMPYLTTKGAHEGTGLGLYMSKLILEKYFQGSLTWKNQDKGACFRIRIPQ